MLTSPALKSWLLTLAGCLLLAGVLPAAAGADPYGELSHFGSRGTGNGQFTEHGIAASAFGVDGTDSNSVYVGDEPEEHVFRIQKLTSSGAFLGAATIKTKGGEFESGIEGVAIDPIEKRFYVLVVQLRVNREIDPETPVAAALYAFSTVPTAGKLEPVAGTTEGLLAGASVFKPQSETIGQPLLEPSGITVDPTTHDVIVMGREDHGEAGSPALRIALERIGKTGALGTRWTDTSGFFEAGGTEEANSPVVTAEGTVYVDAGEIESLGKQEAIVEIPKTFAGAPKPFIGLETGANELVSFPGIPLPLQGAALSLAPDGTLWVYAKILEKAEGEESGFKNPGALAFAANGAEIGWTGGESKKFGLGKCTISVLGHPTLAAGAEGKVFMFDSNPEAPSVLEFGAGGGGCPHARTGSMSATVGGQEHGVIPPGAEVKLSSTIAQADALKVKWSFGDGSAEVETTKNQFQTTEILHKFTGEGDFKVKETIVTDDRATPEVVVERTLTVSKPVPIAKFTETETVAVGVPATFDGRKSTGVEGAPISEYKWDFGDGTTATTTTPTTTHAFGAAGRYNVTLRVTDTHKLTSQPVIEAITVTAPSGGGGGGSGGGGGAGGGGGQTQSGNSGTTEVLSYTASFAGTSLTVSKAGVLTLKVNCAGTSSCVGTVTLRTLTAVKAGRHKSILILGSASFNAAGGQVKTLTLHLSPQGRALLARSHGLRVKATIVARDQGGATHTTVAVLKLVAKKH